MSKLLSYIAPSLAKWPRVMIAFTTSSGLVSGVRELIIIATAPDF